MFNPKSSPEQIKAGMLWLEFESLTPGKGQFDYARSKAQGGRSGCRIPDLYGDAAPGQGDPDLRAQNANMPVDELHALRRGDSKGSKYRLEPPQAQQIYAILDGAMSAVLTRQDADIDRLLADAETKVNGILAKTLMAVTDRSSGAPGVPLPRRAGNPCTANVRRNLRRTASCAPR